MGEKAPEACDYARMNWDDIRYVLALTRKGTLSGAAESLGVTRTTVGRRLRAAEAQLGVEMFERTADGFAPTPAGRDLVEVASRIEDEVLSFEGRAFGRDAELRGELRVSTLELLFDGHADVFATFAERYPGVDLTVRATNDEVSLTRREADVVVRLSNDPAEHLVGRRVGTVQFAVNASHSHVEHIGHGTALSEFPWLHWDKRMNPQWLDKWLAKHAAGARVSMRVDSMSVLRRSVAAGIGVHFLPCFDGDADPGLQRVSELQPDGARELWLLTAPTMRSNHRVRAFMAHAADAFQQRRAALEGRPQGA
jgi:DNA-binding transcriptional LysR family regulator